jgi:Ca2+-binding RTX toxin-like protein
MPANVVNTVTGGTMTGTSGDDLFIVPDGSVSAIKGNGGTDTVDYENATSAINVNLANGTTSGWDSATLTGITQIYGGWYGGTLIGNDNTTYIAAPGGDTTLKAGASGAYLVGGVGNDTFVGGAGNDDIIIGAGSGNNQVDGGGGFNTVDYIAQQGVVVVDLYAGAWHPGGYDSLTNIVNITGSDYGNVLKGDYQNNIIKGGAGNDRIESRQGADTLTGGGGADTFVFEPGLGHDVITDFSHAQGDKIDLTAFSNIHTLSDVQFMSNQSDGGTLIAFGGGGQLTLSNVQLSALTSSDFAFAPGGGGSALPHLFVSTAAAENFAGGSASDTLSYANSRTGVIVDMPSGSSWDGTNNDTFSGISNIIGSSYNDKLWGNGGDNVIDGHGGADQIIGGGGNDTISFASSASGVIIDLGSNSTWDGSNNDTLSGIENAIGSSHNDKLWSDSANNTFTGGLGADAFSFWAHFGHDTITDFTPAQGDTIVFSGVFSNYADMSSHAAQNGADVVITDTAGDTLTLQHTHLADMQAAYFSFT